MNNYYRLNNKVKLVLFFLPLIVFPFASCNVFNKWSFVDGNESVARVYVDGITTMMLFSITWIAIWQILQTRL